MWRAHGHVRRLPHTVFARLQQAIRIGDVYALLVEFYSAQKNMERAFHFIQRMRGANIMLGPYLDQDMVNAVYRAVGAQPEQEEEVEEGVEEEVEEEVEDDM